MREKIPFVSEYRDRHGTLRRKFQRAGFPGWTLHGEPGSPEFETGYAQAMSGQKPAKPVNSGIVPRSLRAAWESHVKTPEHNALKRQSREPLERIAQNFLADRAGTGAVRYGDLPIDLMRRADVKAIVGRPTVAKSTSKQILRILRCICRAAMDLEWIAHDPTVGVKALPPGGKHRAWTDAELVAFERTFDIDETERLIYALALYTGQRRGDIAAMRWADITTDNRITVAGQMKTGTRVVIPIHAELRKVLDITPRTSPWIVTNANGQGYVPESLGNVFADAIRKLDADPGLTLHGLRKTAGRCLAEAGASTRSIMAILGHVTIDEAERYTKEADHVRLAENGMNAWAQPSHLRLVKAS